MAGVLTHTFVSAIADDAAAQAAGEVLPSHWNADHTLTGLLTSDQGGTGNGFTKFTGPTTSEKTFTLPDASSTLLVSGGALGTPASGTLTSCTGLPAAGVVGTAAILGANTFTAVQTFASAANGGVTGASNILSVVNSTNAQSIHLYNTFTDASNYRRVTITQDATSTRILDVAAGTGTTKKTFIFGDSTAGATVGDESVVIGYLACPAGGGPDTVAIGSRALQGLTGAASSDNTAVGYGSLITLSSSSSDSNSAFGAQSGYRFGNNSSRNTVIGAFTGIGIASGTNCNGNIYLGHQAGYYETGSDVLFIDNQSRTNEATARTSSLIYGVMNATVTSQTLALNALVNTPNSIIAQSATAIPAGGTAGAGYRFSSTSNFGVFFGSGAPSLAAAKGSLYLRSDGSGIADRAYINTDGSTAWTNLVTAA